MTVQTPAQAAPASRRRGWQGLLTEQRGPLPVWAWIAIGLSVVVILLYVRRSHQAQEQEVATGQLGTGGDQYYPAPIFIVPPAPTPAVTIVPPYTPPDVPPADNGDPPTQPPPDQPPTQPPADTTIRVGDTVIASGVGTADSYGGGAKTKSFPPTKMRVIIVKEGRPRPYALNQYNQIGPVTGWWAKSQVTKA